MVTGSSVLGITYDGGVILAADTLGERIPFNHFLLFYFIDYICCVVLRYHQTSMCICALGIIQTTPPYSDVFTC